MFVSGEAIKFGNLDPEKAKVIVCHLGNGASVSASIGGKCVDTSMGLTPLEGLIMGTRSGDVDPAVVQFICNKEGKDVNEVLNILNKKSGVLGMSGGISSDFRDIEKAKESGNHLAAVALDAFVYRIAKYVGAYTAAMNLSLIHIYVLKTGHRIYTITSQLCQKGKEMCIRDSSMSDAEGEEENIQKHFKVITNKKEAEKIFKAAVKSPVIGLQPVSYTHLDVYKRQLNIQFSL